MKRLIKYIIIVLSAYSIVVLAAAYEITYGLDRQGYQIYWISNYTNRDLECEVFGHRGYYNYIYAPANSGSRAYYTPKERLTARCR